MVSVSKGLVIANFVLAMGFLAAAIMVRGTRQDLDGQLKKQQETARVLAAKYQLHVDEVGSATKLDTRAGMKRDYSVAEQNRIQTTKALEGKTLDKRTEFKQQGDALIKVHDDNLAILEDGLAKQLEKLKQTREEAESKAKQRDLKLAEVKEAAKRKADEMNRGAQLRNTLETLEERHAETQRRLKAAEKAVGGGST